MPTIRLNRMEFDVSDGTLMALRDALDLRGNIGKDAAIAMAMGKVWNEPQKRQAHDAIDDALKLAVDEHDRNELRALRHELRWDIGLAPLDE